MAEPAAIPTSGILGIHHIGLNVSSLTRSLEHYQGVTPLEQVGDAVLSEPVGAGLAATPMTRAAVLAGPNAFLEFAEYPDLDAAGDLVPVEGPGITHLCFQSPDEEDYFERFCAQGATLVSRDAPVDLGGYGVRYSYLRDADEIMIELEQLDFEKMGRRTFDGPCWIAHVALVTPDIDRLAAFYATLLGTEPYDRKNKIYGARVDAVTGLEDARMRAAWFQVGNMILELWQYLTPPTPVPAKPRPLGRSGYSKFVFEVEDLKAQGERDDLEAASWLSDPVRRNGQWERFARDPDGNLFGMIELSPDHERSLRQKAAITWR